MIHIFILSQVASKPDLYPLVITCGEGDAKAGNYLMVHYFRNYVIRAPGISYLPSMHRVIEYKQTNNRVFKSTTS